ncbi:MAG: hypothetical protein QOJ27_861 [Sphingomonadales bacterium]|nr:hypothetical protein [Sphingomonadales bacterium]
MSFAPPEWGLGRIAIGLGAALIGGSRLIHPEHEDLWLWLGLFFVVLGLSILPKWPEP